MTQSNDGIRTSRRRVLKATGAIVAGLAAPTLLRMSSALAAYPDRPIKIVVANTPGGPSDISARMMAAEMQQVLGNIGAIPVGGTPAELDAFVRAEVARWSSVAKTANITLD